MQLKILLLNGPPRCGKDTAAKILADLIPGAWDYKLSKRLKEMTHGLYGVLENYYGVWRIASHDYFESRKDEPATELRGLTPRQAYIEVSERYIKPVHGQGALGAWLAADLLHNPPAFATISDTGFRAEALQIVAAFPGQVGLIRLHPVVGGVRRDKFSDSRGYIELPVPTADVDSPIGDLVRFRKNLAAALAQVLAPG